MLDKDEMKRRVAFSLKHSPDGTAAAIAAELGITEQAVSGWKKTGTIGKSKLAALARHTKRQIEYFLDSSVTDAESSEDLVTEYQSVKQQLHEVRLVLSMMAAVMVSHRPAEASELVESLRELPVEEDKKGLAQHLDEVLSAALESRGRWHPPSSRSP